MRKVKEFGIHLSALLLTLFIINLFPDLSNTQFAVGILVYLLVMKAVSKVKPKESDEKKTKGAK